MPRLGATKLKSDDTIIEVYLTDVLTTITKEGQESWFMVHSMQFSLNNFSCHIVLISDDCIVVMCQIMFIFEND